jgi:hypothetical protein
MDMEDKFQSRAGKIYYYLYFKNFLGMKIIKNIIYLKDEGICEEH